MTKEQQYFNFLADYIVFYEQMEQQSKNRLEVIASYNLAELERAIANDESSIMRAEQMERRRIELQESAGYSRLSLREIIEKMDGKDKETLTKIYDRLSELLDSIKFFNERSEVIISNNLHRIERSSQPQPVTPVKMPEDYAGGLDAKA